MKIKLFFFPHAGGTVQTFLSWKGHLDTSVIELVPMELPGRGRRFGEKLLHSVPEAVDDLYSIVLKKVGPQPYAFFGHSLGCFIAYELSHKLLQSHGQGPLHLFAAGHNPLHLEFKTCFTQTSLYQFFNKYHLDEAVLLQAVDHCETEGKLCFTVSQIEKVKTTHPEIYKALIKKAKLPHDLPEEDFIDGVLNYGGSPQEIFQNEELKHLLLPILRADAEMYSSYHYAPKPSKLKSDITVLYGKDEEGITSEDIDRWKELTEGACRVYSFGGDHFFLEQNLKSIAKIINETLRLYPN